MNDAVILAVVGHTNVGKTSLLRTLSRNSTFGHISGQSGTTRNTEGMRFKVEGETVIELYDTPGLEDSIALYDYLTTLPSTTQNEYPDSYVRINALLHGPEATGRFEQEAKVLRQLMKSQAGLYVIDVREPVLPKYRDELDILAHCGKPLLPILNFTESERSKEQAWREALSHLALHVMVRFDTVSPPLDGEKKLYESLMILVESARPQLTKWLIDLDKQRSIRHKTAVTLIAETLVDITTAVRWIENDEQKSTMVVQLQNDVRKREQRGIDDLLKLYQFNKDIMDQNELPLLAGRFVNDLFSTEALKQMGVKVSKGIVTGAVAGAGIDLAVGGITVGSAAAIGAIIGGLSQSFRHYGKQMIKRISGQEQLTVDDAIICLLSLRLQQLQQVLDNRGHASQQKLKIVIPNEAQWRKGKLLSPLKIARAHPEWSTLNKKLSRNSISKKEAINQLVEFMSAVD